MTHLMPHERAAADTQGITALTATLTAHGLTPTIENTGGRCMVATVTLPDGDVIALIVGGNDNADTLVHAGRHTAAQWAGDDLHAEPEAHDFPDAAAAAWWIKDRIADLTPLPDDAAAAAVTWTITTDTDTLDAGTGTREEAWAAYERTAAQVDHEMREVGSIVLVALVIDGHTTTVRDTGALTSDWYARSGWKYLAQVAAHIDPFGHVLTASVEDTGGSIHVPVIRVGATHVITVVDDAVDGQDVAYSASVETTQSWDAIAGDYITVPWDGAHATVLDGLDGARVAEFIRVAMATVAPSATPTA